jgi:hypothetical protein
MVAGSRRRDAVALIGVVVLLVAAAWIVRQIRTSNNPVNSATVYGAYLAVAAIMVPLLMSLLRWWWRGRRVTAVPVSAVQVLAAADQLAQRMLDTWRREAKARRISTPAPVRVRWQWGPAEVTPPLADVITAPVSGIGPRPLPEPNPNDPNSVEPGVLLEAGVVTRLHKEVYDKLPHGRLVLLGGPGAGKTGAMILLLLAALDHRHSTPKAQRSEIPVPVWLTLGGWDPGTQTLHQWAAATMYRDHPYLRAPEYGPDGAGELLLAGQVALFLDGLDEMTPSAQSKALARIEQEGAGLRIVLSSRPAEYRQALSEERVHNTAVIELRPVDPEMACAYLLHDQIGFQRDQWAQLCQHLTHHPDSIVAHALNNPLTLSLARTTYQDQDPTPLTDPTQFATVAVVREHLIKRTLITAYPDEHQRIHAIRWLAWIAHHMGSERDLAWWHIPTWIHRRQLQRALGLVGGLVCGLAFGLSGLARGLPFGLAGGFGFGLAGGFAGCFGGGFAFRLAGRLAFKFTNEVTTEPLAIFLRWPRPRELLRLLAVGLAFGLPFGLVFGLAGGLVRELVFGLVFGLAVGITGLIALWTVPLPRAATATPAARYWADRRTSIVFGLGVGLVVGVTLVLTLGSTLGLAGGLAGGLAVGLTDGSVSKVSLTELVLATTGAGRVKFIQVLKDAHHRQILRQAGAVYQFRHAELQDHLAEIRRRHTETNKNLNTDTTNPT